MRRWWTVAAAGMAAWVLGSVTCWAEAAGVATAARTMARPKTGAGPCAPGRSQAPTVWIVAGQSQATTFGMSRATLPFAWAPDPNVYIWVWDNAKRAGRWEPYEPGVNSAPAGRWGPEVQLIREFRRDHPTTPLGIVKYAPGQTGVALDPDRADWNIHSRGEAWERLAAMGDSALRTCGLKPAAVFWMGNHHDGLRADHAERAETDMADLVGASRARWGASLRWIVGLPDDTAPHAETVRRGLAQLDRRDRFMTTFDTREYGTQPDGLHYDAASVIRLGRDFYRGWRRGPSR